jgi:hypothetical protein
MIEKMFQVVKLVDIHWLTGAVTVILLLVVGIMMLPLLADWSIMAEATAEDELDEHEDVYDEWDGTEGDWSPLLNKLPAGQEVVRVNGSNSMTTGTNDFFITVWRNTNGIWKVLPSGDLIDPSDYPGRDDRNILMDALQQKWEFKMKIPTEVAEKLNDGYNVGVAVSDVVKKENFTASTQDLYLVDLFDLSKALQYKFEDEYLYIKGYPQVHIRHTICYYEVVGNFEKRIPITSPNYGSNPHNIYTINNLGKKSVGSTSTVIDDVDLLEKYLTDKQQKALEAEVVLAQKFGWIHFSQIKDASGFLDGYKIDSNNRDEDKTSFWFSSWLDGEGEKRSSAEYKIGNGTYTNADGQFNGSFKDGGDIGLWFWYPL